VASSATPPASWYFDPLVVPTLEREKVFAKGWTWAGRLDQVATNGSYLVGATGTVKYVVVRGEDGVLRAFHNACRHHGMEIANCPKSTAKCFACPYHGWTYDLDGSLVKATKIGGMRDFVVAEHGLKPIRVAEWGPFVMLRLGDPATEEEEEEEEEEEAPIEAWMGPDVAAKISASWSDDPKSMRFVARREYRLRCNWKVFADNYLDGGYHVPFAHPALVTDGVDMRKYETEVYGEYVSVQTHGAPAAELTRLGDSALYAFVYPNLMINRYGPWMDVNVVLPTGPNECMVLFDYFIRADATGATDAFVNESLRASDAVQSEDKWLCEKVQGGLESPGYGTGRYAPAMEAAMYHFHRRLWRDLTAE
ncbi:chloroplast envelope protein translocase family, partial [Micromonas commoda]